MNPTYIIVAIILCGLFHVSIQVCFMDPGSFHYYYSRAIFCSNVTNLKDEIKTVEYSDYMNNLKVNDSNFITIDNFFTTHNHLFSLTISTCKIGTIATSAFKNIDLSKLIIENNKINYLSIGAFNASLMTSLSLRNNSLTDIDSNIFSGNIPNLRSLDLSYNNIKSITGFMNIPSLTKFDISHNYNFQSNSLLNLNKLTSLKELNINNCNLDSIPTEGLSELESLEKIDMSENKFIRLKGNDFPPSLISLFASKNSISHITNSWNHLKNLTTLDLSNNYLAGQNFPFEDCISMTILELKNNKLDDYSLNNMFDKLNNISVVNLDNNKLTKLDCNMLTNKGQLKEFFVSSNNINHLINPEKCPKSIENFNMSNNRLSSISSFSKMSNLTQLDLSNNELEILNYDTFKNLKKLNTLYLNNNKLKSWPIGCFRDLNSLETLKLEHNFVSQLGHGSFSGLMTLGTLNMAYNELKEIDEEVFGSLKSLKVFDISWNKLNNFDVARALSHIDNAVVVHLDGNKYTCSNLARVLRSSDIIYGSVFNESNVNGVRCDIVSEKGKDSPPLPEVIKSIYSSLKVITVILIILFCGIIGIIVWRFIQQYVSFSSPCKVRFRN